MRETIKVNVYNNDFDVEKGITLLELSEKYGKSDNPIVAAKVGNQLRHLNSILESDSKIEFVDLTSMDGSRIYTRSLELILLRAAKELFDGIDIFVEHSIGNSIYCNIDFPKKLTENDIDAIKNRMMEIINADEEIVKTVLPKEKALEMFKDTNQLNKYNVIKYREKETVNIYSCGNETDYFYGYLVPRTGYLKVFDVKAYEDGIVLMFPSRRSPNEIKPFRNINKLFKVYQENKEWAKILAVEDVGELNKCIEEGKGGELIRLSEALQEKKVANIADQIANNKNNIRVILIAGPSSSGKTTFAQRLSVQLMVNGLRPISISMDNYFVNRDDTPLDEEGNRDYECIEALDLKLFNIQLKQLLNGEEVEVPIYSFKKGMREEKGVKMKVNPDQVIIIEGIHGLNERLTESVPRENKFKIYISSLTQIRIDNHNRIPTTDTRIIRRMVRDFHFRGYSASCTIGMWPLVRRGEERNIFPFQEEADVMFNSALIYELAVLKSLADPLLNEIGIDQPEYSEAKRLKDFLSYFVELDTHEIPPTSIIREFLGGSCFHKED